jgi:hypothetical protein
MAIDTRKNWVIFLDSKATWAAFGMAAGTFFGETGLNIINAVGVAVMAFL